MFLFYDCRARPLFPFLHHDALCARTIPAHLPSFICLMIISFDRHVFLLFSVFVWFLFFFFHSRTLIHTACPFANHFCFERFKFIDITFSEPFCMFSSHLTFRHYKWVCVRARLQSSTHLFLLFFTDKRESTYYIDIFRSIGIVWCMVCGFDHLKNFRILNIYVLIFSFNWLSTWLAIMLRRYFSLFVVFFFHHRHHHDHHNNNNNNKNE